MFTTHVYWVFKCEGCETQFDYCYLGVFGTVDLAHPPIQPSFQFRCPNCGKSHIYSHQSLYLNQKPNSPHPGAQFVCGRCV
jgi:predicted RNA-binding Zn-ribbon protein involved in translation (DUF1610 family)